MVSVIPVGQLMVSRAKQMHIHMFLVIVANLVRGVVESEVVGVHNGIIENYTELKEKLLKHGYTFYSQTDTEVVIKLVDYYYKKYNLGPVDAIAKTRPSVRG